MDILSLDIIDFNRLNGYWDNPAQALDTIFSWFNPELYCGYNVATITKVRIPNFNDAPIRTDFPGWSHVGGHEAIAKDYWDWFYWNHPGGNLHLSDSPDFYGNFEDGTMFWGDIGKVSASAFAITQKTMGANDLWISIPGGGSTQTIIETHIDIKAAFYNLAFDDLSMKSRCEMTIIASR